MHYTLTLDYKKFPEKPQYVIERDFVEGLAGLLCSQLRVQHDTAGAIAQSLYGRMSDASLHYHTHPHPLSMLQFVQELQKKYPNRIALSLIDELAVWFHDAVYLPHGHDGENERDSGDFAVCLLRPFLAQQQCGELSDRILATSKHMSIDVEEKHHLILDLDVCSFAWDVPDYNRANDMIAEELSAVHGIGAFIQGRKKFLQAMLAKPSLFRTAFFRETFEQKAQENLQRSLEAFST